MKEYKKTGKCSLCDGTYTHYGNNPEPLKRFRERCCDDCNATKVIPVRLKGEYKEGIIEVKDLGICVRCKKNKAKLVFTESALSYAHGFVENICQECYDKMQKAHPLYKMGWEEANQRFFKMIEEMLVKNDEFVAQGNVLPKGVHIPFINGEELKKKLI